MRKAPLYLLVLLLAPVLCSATQLGFGWWNASGDALVLDGVTIRLTGTGIQRTEQSVQDPPGPENASFTFTFDPPVESFQILVRSITPWESIQFGSPPPTSVGSPTLVASGSPIQVVHGFRNDESNEGTIRWYGPGLRSVSFTTANADGSIVIAGIGYPADAPDLMINEILLQTTLASPNAVQVDVAISDSGVLPEVSGFIVLRQAIYPCKGSDWEIVHCVDSRQPGTVSHHTIMDTNGVQPNTQYVYMVEAANTGLCVPGGDQLEFLREFSPYSPFPVEIVAFVSTGTEPVPIAHGVIRSGDDPIVPQVVVAQCTDSCNYPYGTATADVWQYADTGTEVLLYGSIVWVGNAYGYMCAFTAAEPHSCTLAVREATWSQVKRLYRDPR